MRLGKKFLAWLLRAADRYAAVGQLGAGAALPSALVAAINDAYLDRLHRRFGLTPSEGRLAVHLATGEALRMATSTLGITYETARTQLKTVFAKIGTNRQTELVVVILTTVTFTAPEAT
jgi:DNA-binding CsgD family transcriptional regulator